MKKFTAICLLLAMLLVNGRAEGLWDASRKITGCREDRSACLTLQAVMMGSFEDFDPQDGLSSRVFSAALGVLSVISEEDILHFCDEFEETAAAVYPIYYRALGNCLWAEVICSDPTDSEDEAIRKVLMLFLNPEAYADTQAQMEIIRSEIQEDLLQRFAERTGTPEGFIRHLILGETPVSE